jgi:hypothetical protein
MARGINPSQEDQFMLWFIFTILIVLWLLGMVTSTTLGGFLHILLIVAIAAVLIRVIQGRQPFG